MFDFRYHALSLVAVFVALLIGLLLGVAIGDEGLVSSAERQLRSNLRSDVADANRRADELRADVAESQRFASEVYAPLVADRLLGQRVAVLFLGEGSEDLADDVRTALEDTGGRVVAVGVVREPLDVPQLAQRAADTRYENLAVGDEDLAQALGVRMGVQLVSGGELLGRLRPTLFRTLNGSLDDVTMVVLIRRPPKLEGAPERTRAGFEEGFVQGLRETAMRVVGAEDSDADPSQIGWYEDRDLSSVDALDRIEGRAGLVLTLAGAEGTFGIKDSADALLPDVVGGTP
ncbi:hypothetical protein GKE82_01485 [Conexibacter sp. W3-3-2]|uniref:Copper transporter n=1 Tax=Paraconexibacter algicola TaxID=2133960 RepID=A0A2T4UC39_9ACTN|nr:MULTISPECIES: copper transporter [Solirubrobacterales]MTD43011.1 hypothetical protein [Conexibacter sp. W3-3-2]PTL54780.1 hypothetical protein C7Y72_19495 [Paraconexibacter algicola]